MKFLFRIFICFLISLGMLQMVTMKSIDQTSSIHEDPSSDEPHVNVTLFYESLCPYSIKFLVSQLYPVTMKYGNFMTVDLIPFGHSMAKHNKNGTWDFKCQHGAEECYGNRVHACVIGQGRPKGQEKTLEVLACLMHFDYTIPQITKCLEKSNFNYERHDYCMRNEATDLELAYGRRTSTHVPPVKYVPFVMFNGVYNNTVEDLSIKHLEYVVCDLMGSNRPDTCPKYHYNYIVL